MIPYWYYPTYTIGGFTFQTWGTFVSLGILVAILIAARKAKKVGLDPKQIFDLAFWIIIAAFVGARLGHVFFYDWGYFKDHLTDIPKIWLGGYSSFGGFLGAIIAVLIMSKKLSITNYQLPITKLQIADILIFGLPLGWAIGRLGCFFTHLHPGIFTNFFLGVNYPDGVRHDLGLYDSLNALALAFTLLIFGKKLEKRPGATVAFVSIWYGTIRFFLDFLRAFDARYLGLTPAQYGSIILVLVGVVIMFKCFKSPTPYTLHPTP